jgi:crotonobetainyl-CoA:carnitine CoA-transferase CaiB-like acyl-CoA transferase
MTERALEGIKVIDLTSALSGPFCAMMLGDMGAEVIKVEEPTAGDMNRTLGPFIGGEGGYFLYANRNKRSITINLREERGREILLKLVKDADIFIENFRPGVKNRLRIDYETLKAINPRLIYCSISGFGQTGPWAERPGFDQIAQGMSGLMSVTGFPETGPTRVGVAIGDSACGVFAAFGILAALAERNRSGTGQYLETSLLEGLIAHLGFQAVKYFGTGERPTPQGNDHATIAPYGTFKTRDGYINIAAGNLQMWERLCQALGLEPLLSDARFQSNADRVGNKGELRNTLEARLSERNSGEWVEFLNREGIACGPINSIDQVFADEQVLHQEMLLHADHPTAGKIQMVGFPVKMHRTPCKVSLPPPLLGQHTPEILKGLAYTEAEISTLKKDGVI